MKGFLIRCAIAGAMIGGAAAASFQAISTSAPATGLNIASNAQPAAVSAPAAAAPAVAAPVAAAPATQAAAAPAVPTIPTDPKGCVGSGVSFSAHFFGGLGDRFHDFGQNPANSTVLVGIKEYATNVCGKH